MKPIKVVQIGTGHDHAFQTMRALLKLDEYEVLGVAEPNPDYVYRLSQAPFSAVPQYSADEILDLEGVQAVIVETDELLSTEWAQKAVDRGLPVHMDKPGSPSLTDFEKLIASVKEKNVPFHTGYMYRTNPMIRKYLAQAKAGELGKIVSIEAQMSVRHPDDKRAWLGNFPGGMNFYLGCHLVDLILLFQGMPKRIIPFNKASGDGGVTAEDIGFAVFEYEDGVSFVKSSAAEVNGCFRRQLVISGTKATVEMRPIEGAIGNDYFTAKALVTKLDEVTNIWGNCGKEEESEVFQRYEPMMQDFAYMVGEGKVNEYTPDYELALFRCVLQACGVQEE